MIFTILVEDCTTWQKKKKKLNANAIFTIAIPCTNLVESVSAKSCAATFFVWTSNYLTNSNVAIIFARGKNTT